MAPIPDKYSTIKIVNASRFFVAWGSTLMFELGIGTQVERMALAPAEVSLATV